MPARPFRPCAHAGCARLVNGKDSRCIEHMRALRNAAAQRRDNATQSLYGAQWRKARAAFLRHNPLCVGALCAANGFITPARVVDHIRPHKGDLALFWDKANWQPLCVSCHNSKTAREDGGFGRAVA